MAKWQHAMQVGGLLVMGMACVTACGDDATPYSPGGQGGQGGTTPVAGTEGGPQGGASGATGGGVGGASGGVGGDGGAGGQPSGDVMCSAEPDKTGSCKESAEGIYAIKSELDVWWGGQEGDLAGLVSDGRGKLTIFLHGQIEEICENGSDGRGVIKACGTDIPPFFMDLLCEAYKIEIPNEAWDSPNMPTFLTKGNTTGFEPGDTLTLLAATGLVGIDLNDPNQSWPSADQTGSIACAAGTGQACFPDHDNDGKAGITVHMRDDEATAASGCGLFGTDPYIYKAPPVNFDPGAVLNAPVARADLVYVGNRVRLGGAGEIASDCASGVGIAEAEFFDSRAIGCQQKEGTVDGFGATPAAANQDCSAAQAEFLDANIPIWNVLQTGETPPSHITITDRSASPGARSALVRLGNLGDNITCADVRNAPFPAFD
jgi:hypothetical protein